MCGITGFYAFNGLGHIFGINMANANQTQTHRGPDTGYLFNENRMGLGHRRLSILDLSVSGRQPMTDESGRYTIVFNGEIFNFQTLRKDLISKGVSFRSETDTEVLLYLYRFEKEKCLEKLNGFFAFAIYDLQEDSLFLARDRYGIKPLVYYLDEDKFLFASEINTLLAYRIPKEIDYTSVFEYFQLHYVPSPNSIFQNIFKLPPAHFLTLKGREMELKSYYQIPYSPFPKPVFSYEQAQNQLLSLLEDSVKSRLIADVPLGAFLSGGTDSSAVVALATRHTSHLKTFSIGFADEPFFDETRYAQLVAKKFKTEHTVFSLKNEDLFEAIFQFLPFLGEPFADSSAIPFYILSQRTRQKITVALSGDGADEIFGGYNKYQGEYTIRKNGFLVNFLKNNVSFLEKLPQSRGGFWTNKFRQANRLAKAANLSAQERYWFLSSFLPEKQALGIFTEKTKSQIDQEIYTKRKKEILQTIENQDFSEVFLADSKLVLPNDMLHKVDMASMANSLEVRVPFLDYRMVNFAFSLPTEFKIDGKHKKRILKDAFRQILPSELYSRPKHGFDVPLAKGYKTVLRNWIEKELLADDFVESQGIFDLNYIQNLKKTIFGTKPFDQNHVWAILVFQAWWKAKF